MFTLGEDFTANSMTTNMEDSRQDTFSLYSLANWSLLILLINSLRVCKLLLYKILHNTKYILNIADNNNWSALQRNDPVEEKNIEEAPKLCGLIEAAVEPFAAFSQFSKGF